MDTIPITIVTVVDIITSQTGRGNQGIVATTTTSVIAGSRNKLNKSSQLRMKISLHCLVINRCLCIKYIDTQMGPKRYLPSKALTTITGFLDHIGLVMFMVTHQLV